jgi:hypothetical protein
MAGCVMAVDGLCVRTRAPYKSETRNIADYRCRKGGFAVLVMAGCDVDGKFSMAVANNSGATHDVVAWNTSAFNTALLDNKLDNWYFCIRDEAFSTTEQMLSPWPGRGLGRWKDSFNYWLSHSRQAIERAFGMLVRRWGIFWRPLICSYERWSLVVLTCMKLHNLCTDRKVTLPFRRFQEDEEPGDEFVVWGNDDPEYDNQLHQNRATGGRRLRMTQTLRDMGRGRPQHAMCRSRAA